jgi:voltage-gated potassium channel
VTLSAHALRADLPIVARSNYPDAVNKLRLAGASRVVSPYTMAGQQMAMLAVRPSAVDFVETLLRGTSGSLLLEDIELAASAPLIGLAVPELRTRFGSEATVLAVRRGDRLFAPPAPDLLLAGGDVIVVAGTDKQLRELELACPAGASSVTSS